jgi:hypothetical protein
MKNSKKTLKQFFNAKKVQILNKQKKVKLKGGIINDNMDTI